MERCVQCTCYQIFVLNLLFYFCSSLSVARISSAPGASGSGAAPDANKTTNTQNLIDAIVTHKFSSGDSAGAPGSHPMPTSAAALNATVTKATGVAAAAVSAWNRPSNIFRHLGANKYFRLELRGPFLG